MLVRALAIAVLLATPALVSAQEIGGCDSETLKGPELTACLTSAQKQSTEVLKLRIEGALASIATRPGVFDTQRARWKNSLTISQEEWVRFRNDECQNVAPFEGQSVSTSALRNRVAAFEAKLICDIEMNTARSADLARRYPDQ